jgi:inhibitor of KinA
VSRHRIVADGDAMLAIEFEERIDPLVSARAAAVAEALEAARMPGVRDIVPTYRTVAVYFDPLRTERATLRRELEATADRIASTHRVHRGAIEVPVCYGDDLGPDLRQVAAFAEIDEDDVVTLHSQRTYQVLMIGFMPGFAYLGSVDPKIAAPRLDTPRLRVPRGSVGIANEQTGIYPSETPGGWQLIGRTPLRPFDMSRREPFLFRAGDEVRFVPIARPEFERRVREG